MKHSGRLLLNILSKRQRQFWVRFYPRQQLVINLLKLQQHLLCCEDAILASICSYMLPPIREELHGI